MKQKIVNFFKIVNISVEVEAKTKDNVIVAYEIYEVGNKTECMPNWCFIKKETWMTEVRYNTNDVTDTDVDFYYETSHSGIDLLDCIEALITTIFNWKVYKLKQPDELTF